MNFDFGSNVGSEIFELIFYQQFPLVTVFIIYASGFEDGSVCLHKILNTRQPVIAYCPHERAVNKLAFSPRR